jgi:hypothetical protein
MSRRSVLQLAGLAGVAALVGCSGDDGASSTGVPDSPTASTTTTTAAPTAAGEELLGYREGLYPTGFPTERKNLNGTHSLADVGFPRDVMLDDIAIETIEMPYPVLLYTRDPGELFVIGGTPLAIAEYVGLIDGLPPGENKTAPYFARVDTVTGEITYLDLDRGQGVPYLGGALMHADGYAYVVSQSHLYRIDPDSMQIEASIDLPADGPATVYNGLAVGRTRQLILKSLSFADGDAALSLVEPETLEIVFTLDCDCRSPRLTLAVDDHGVEHLYHLNREQTFRYIVEEDSLTLDENWIIGFDPDGTGINQEPTSPVVVDGRVFYTTNTNLQAKLPMRVFWQDQNATYTPDMEPLAGPLLFDDPGDRAGWSFSGLSADEATGILMAVDQQRGLVNAFRPNDDGSIDILWQHEMRVSASNTNVSDRQMVYVTDFVDGSNHLVVLDLLTGEELVRIPTPAARATIGAIVGLPNGDVYLAANEPGQPTGFLIRFSSDEENP